MKVTSFKDKSLNISDAKYKAGTICSYWFKYPLDARPGDIVQIDLSNLKAMKIYAAVGSSVFTAKGPLIAFTGGKRTLKADYPDELFITLASNDFEN